MYRIWIEEVLGVKIRANTMFIDPVLPPEWPGFELKYRYGTTTYQLRVERTSANSSLPNDRRITLKDDGLVHEIVIFLPVAVREFQTA
jgi:cyclic beta-1,2-glucan synthetase